MSFKPTTKTIQFEIPECIYSHFSDFINQVLKPKVPLTVDYLFRAFAINRAISLGYLNELGEPNELIFPPTLDFSKIDSQGLPISSLRDISCGSTDK